MATMAKWGSKTWAVSRNKVVALEGLSFSYTQVADNNSSTEEKKPTNERGTELMPLAFTTVLHSGAGVDVMAEIESWKALVTKVEYFYLGGKNLGPKFQLRKVSVDGVRLDNLGRMRLATLSFEFKEYDHATSSVKVSTSALNVKANTDEKKQKKASNTGVKNATTQTIKVGCYVSIPGLNESKKQSKHRVVKITGDRVQVAHTDGTTSWVNINNVSFVDSPQSTTEKKLALQEKKYK